MGPEMQEHGAQGVGAPLVPTERLLGVPAPLHLLQGGERPGVDLGTEFVFRLYH